MASFSVWLRICLLPATEEVDLEREREQWLVEYGPICSFLGRTNLQQYSMHTITPKLHTKTEQKAFVFALLINSRSEALSSGFAILTSVKFCSLYQQGLVGSG